MVNKEADHKTHTRTAAPPLFRIAKGQIAKQGDLLIIMLFLSDSNTV